MPLTVTGDQITSDRATRIARLVPGRPPARQVTWLPGRLLDRGSAVTAITLAVAAARSPRPGRRIWPHTGNRAAEPGQTTPQAITHGTRPPETSSGRTPAVNPPGRQARR
jgi:hypothetical protein